MAKENNHHCMDCGCVLDDDGSDIQDNLCDTCRRLDDASW
jgi:transcription initiation factor TFIIIB Brf1 subunit/transcription initiation factor TFIIB